MSQWVDAHCHWHDPRLRGIFASQWWTQNRLDYSLVIVNGTCPDDWERVHQFCSSESFLRPAYGVHPWKVHQLPPNWLEDLRTRLEATAMASLGEVGLDQWVAGADPALQNQILRPQLELAAELNRPVTFHVLRAWEAFSRLLLDTPLPPAGFLVHAFSGSIEILDRILDLGGYVSFSGYARDPRRKRMRAAIRHAPPDRILTETDSPNMAPPAEICRFPLVDAEGQPLHHPGDIASIYTFLQNSRPAIQWHTQIHRNAQTLFSSSLS